MPSPPPARAERRTRLEARPALTVALAGLTLVGAAVLFGAVPLFVAGVGFVALAGLAPLWLALASRPVRVRRHLVGDRVVEDEPLEAVIEVRRGVLGLPGGELHDPLAGPPVALAEPLSLLPGRRQVTLRVITRVHRRGRHSFPPPQLVLSDAFGLARLRRSGGGNPDDVLVLPRTEPVRWRGREQRRAAAGDASRTTHEPMGAGDVDGLRQYLPGTPASRIHWPALARGAGLLERRLVSEAEHRPLVVLDPRIEPSARAEERLDAAVRAAASLIIALGRSGGCYVLLPGDVLPVAVEPGLASWPALHTRLALVESRGAGAPGPRLRSTASTSTTGAIIYVAAAAPSPPAWANRRARRGSLILVVPASAGTRPDGPVSFEVAGCVGVNVGAGGREGRAAA